MNRARLELVLVAATGLLHPVFADVLHWSGAYVGAAIAFWGGYVAWRLRVQGQARQWGIRGDNLGYALAVNGGVAALGTGAMIAYGAHVGRGAPQASFFFLLAAYPIWGFVQQLIICPLVYGNLRLLTKSHGASVALASLTFGLVHLPNVVLAMLTTVAALVWTSVFARVPNLWAQGAAHGTLAAIAYHFVLGRDPWTEIVESLR